MVLWMIVFALLTMAELIRFVERANRDLTNFLLAIKQNDFSNIYPEAKRQHRNLYQAFNVITNEFVKLRSEKESNYHFFKAMVEHSRVPLLTYELGDERVSLMNEAARDLFEIPYMSKLDSLRKVSVELYATVRSLATDKKILLKIRIGESVVPLSVVAKVLVLKEKTFKVLAFYNLNTELDHQEIESWQKLIRVLTHEIKNSVIPISTLSEVIHQMVTNDDGSPRPIDQLDEEDEEDLRISLRTIEKRSKGLVKFVNSYGDLARTPTLDLEEIEAQVLIKRVLELESQLLAKHSITLKTDLPQGKICLTVDTSAVEQVLINIIKNAVEALEGSLDAQIMVALRASEGKVLIAISDTGPGIDDETLSNIFVPFYTTKKEGSGIGLPLSRQILKAHGGNITVSSQVGEGTTFELSFPLTV